MTPADTPVTVYFPASLDVENWERRNAADEVPSRWPYGLDGLQDVSDGSDVRAATLPALEGLRGKASKLLASSGSLGRLVHKPQPGVGLCWDENYAVTMFRLRPHERMYTGVVWFTDDHQSMDAKLAKNTLDALRQMNAVWVLSEAQIEPMNALLGPSGPRVEFVPFGVDADFFTPQAVAEEPEPLVLSLGNDRHRDAATTLEGLSRVRESVPGSRMLVQQRGIDPGIDAQTGIEIMGRVSHERVREFYGDASVVAVATEPNLHGSGMTVALEAMASARPVVITATEGMDHYIEDGVTGILVDPGDPDAFADAVTALLRDPELAQSMGEAGRRAVEQQFTTQHLARGISDLIRSRG